MVEPDLIFALIMPIYTLHQPHAKHVGVEVAFRLDELNEALFNHGDVVLGRHEEVKDLSDFFQVGRGGLALGVRVAMHDFKERG